MAKLEAAESAAGGAGLRATVMKGGAFLFARQMVTIVLSLIGVMMITRVIGPEHYGSFAAAIGIYTYAANVGQLGVGVYLVRYAGTLPEHEYGVAYMLLLAMAALVVGAIEAGMGLITGWVHVQDVGALLTVLMIALPFQLLGVPASAQLERALDYRKVAMAEVSGQLCYYGIAVPMVAAGFNAWSLVAGAIAQQAVTFTLFHFYAKRLPRLAWDLQAAKTMFHYAVTYSFANWLWQIRYLVNPLIGGHFLQAEQVGQIGIAIRLMELLTFVKTIAWRLSVATLSRLQHDPEKLRRAIGQGMQLQTLALAPILLGFGWVGGWLIPMMFGERWVPMLAVYPFIALSYLTNAQFNMHSSVLYVLRRNAQVAIFHTCHVVLFAAAAAFLMPRLGIIGYGWGEVVALAAYAVIHVFIVRAVGQPDYLISTIWWGGATLGLFWRELGLWTIAAPFAALLWPASIRQLRLFFADVWGRTLHARQPA